MIYCTLLCGQQTWAMLYTVKAVPNIISNLPCLESVAGHKTLDQLLPGNYATVSAHMYYAFGGSDFHVSMLGYSCVSN